METIKAKEIFFSYNGQHYFMDHDGVYDEYKKYNISEIVEKEWIEELVKLRLNEYKESSDYKYLTPLVDYYNRYDLIIEIVNVKLKGAFINKIIVLEDLTKILCNNKGKIKNYEKNRKIIIRYYNILKEENISKENLGYNIDKRFEKIKEKLGIKNA
jgi:hypothetical protein